MIISRKELLRLLWWGECDFTLTADKKLKDPTGKIVGELKKASSDTKSDAAPINRIAVKTLSV